MTIFRLSVLGICVAAIAPAAIAQVVQVNKENRTIAVTATDKVTVLADTATVHIGFIVFGPDSDWAYATGSRLSNAIMKALTDAAIPADAIQSENQNISAVPDFQVERLTPAERGQQPMMQPESSTSPSRQELTSPVRLSGASEMSTLLRPRRLPRP
jgi:uncharacterized protein